MNSIGLNCCGRLSLFYWDWVASAIVIMEAIYFFVNESLAVSVTGHQMDPVDAAWTREGQQGGRFASEWHLLFWHGWHSGVCAGIGLMGWESAVDGSLMLGCADISPAPLFFHPLFLLLSIHTDVFWWFVSLKLKSTEEVISQSVTLISSKIAACLRGVQDVLFPAPFGLLFPTLWALTWWFVYDTLWLSYSYALFLCLCDWSWKCHGGDGLGQSKTVSENLLSTKLLLNPSAVSHLMPSGEDYMKPQILTGSCSGKNTFFLTETCTVGQLNEVSKVLTSGSFLYPAARHCPPRQTNHRCFAKKRPPSVRTHWHLHLLSD